MYLWGRSLPPGPTAESWEIAAHENGTTTVSNGPYRGKPLTKLQDELGLALIGSRNRWAAERDKFPLLIKLLDAQEALSVQVHPDDAYARLHEGNELGKTEAWVVLHAQPGAAVILGVKADTTADNFRQAALNGRLERYLHRIPVRSGDFVYVPAGSVHAILGGVVIAEIQQNSDTTYRLYDWNRRDPKRPLHLNRGLDVIDFEQVEPHLTPPRLLAGGKGVRRFELCQSRYFALERVEMPAGTTYGGRCDGSTLEIWGVTHGQALVIAEEAAVDLAAVRFTLLPAAMGVFTVQADEDATLLRVYVPGEE